MARTELIVKRPKPTFMEMVRSYWSGPLTAKSPELARWFGGGPTLSGVPVNESTAMNSSAVFSAVSLISDDIASLPLFLYKRLANGGKDRFESHPLYRLLHDAPNPEMGSMVLRRTLMAHLLLCQNAFAEIERNGAGQAIALWPLEPERVAPYRSSPDAPLSYIVRNPSGRDTSIPAQDMLHLVGRSHDGSWGCSLIDNARESIGLGLAAEKFGAAFFGNGSTFGGTLSYAGPKPPELSDKNYRETLEARHHGVERAFRLLTLFNGAKFERVGVNPNEGQFNETRVFQIREVARWFKMPPHKLGDLADATYSNVEQMDAAYLSGCIRPWLVLWEQELTRKLVPRLELNQQFVQHDTHGFLSVDAAARSELYTAQFRIGGLKPNEHRGYENLDPIDGGEDAFVSLDVIPLPLARKHWELQHEKTQAEIDKLKEPTPAPVVHAPPPPQEDPADRAALRQAVEALTTAREQEATEKRQAQQRAEDLSAALAETQEHRDKIVSEYTHTLELLDGAKVALDAEKAERALDKTTWDDERGLFIMQRDGYIGAIEGTQLQLQAETQRAAALTQEKDDGIASAIAALDAEKGERAQEKAGLEQRATDAEAHAHAVKREAEGYLTSLDNLGHQVVALGQEKDAETTRANVAEEATKQATEAGAAALAAAQAEITRAEGERDDVQRTLSEVRAAHTLALSALEGERDAARAEAQALTAERDAVQVGHAEATAARDAAVQERDAARLAATQAEADTVTAGQRADAAERDRGIAEQAQTAANETIASLQAELQQTRESHAARVNGLLVAHRGLVVDVMRRMVEREMDRARRHQTTPQKFRAWLDTFYQTHGEAVAEALLPAVRAHLAILSSQSDPHELARTLAEDHIAESEKQLRDLLHVEDFAPHLERTLMRWETTRPEQVADRLLTKGLSDVR
jgi:HK97 family phage portal protein